MTQSSKTWALYAFQSTLPAGGATKSGTTLMMKINDFNPRSPQGERRESAAASSAAASNFNPRSPQGERPTSFPYTFTVLEFQSTLPAGGATTGRQNLYGSGEISIHAPRRGSDAAPSTKYSGVLNFNPRSPQGERQYSQSIQQ